MTEQVHDITDLPHAPEPQEISPADARRRNRTMLRAVGFDLNKTYYVSGPMSGYDDYNYPEFERVTALLRSCGLDVESPHENPWPEGYEDMHPKRLWDHMMAACEIQMKQCSGIIMLKGWPQSKGARKELLYGLRRNWPVWFMDGDSLYNMNKQEEVTPDAAKSPDAAS